MRPELHAHGLTQGGLVTRAQALAGCTERELRTLTGPSGDLVVVRRGVYAQREQWDTWSPAERYAATVRATVLSCDRPAVPSHASAAALLGLPLRPHWCELVHLTRPAGQASRVASGVKHHRSALPEAHLREVGQVWVTSPARTALDIAREHGVSDGVVACDAGLEAGATTADLRAACAAMSGWPGATRAAAAVDLARPGAESIGETLLRLLVVGLGLGTPQTQFEVVDAGRRARVDLRLRRHLFEFDGRVKYLGAHRGGVAAETPEDVVWAEKQREDWLRGLGYGMSRVTWRELFAPLRRQTEARLREDVLRSDRLYGG